MSNSDDFLDVEIKDCIFGPGIKTLGWKDEETRAFMNVLDNEHGVRNMIKNPKSSLRDKKTKAWYFVYERLRDDFPRLKDLKMEQLTNKWKTAKKMGNKAIDGSASQFKTSCNRTGGGKGDRRPPTPTGEEVIDLDSSGVSYPYHWAGTHPQQLFMQIPKTNTKSTTSIVEDGDHQSESAFTPTVIVDETMTDHNSEEYPTITPPPPYIPSLLTEEEPSTSGTSTTTTSRTSTSEIEETPKTKKRKTPKKTPAAQDELPKPKKRMTNEEDNFLRNKRSEILMVDQLMTNNFIRVRQFYEVKKICKEQEFDWEEAEKQFNDIQNDQKN